MPPKILLRPSIIPSILLCPEPEDIGSGMGMGVRKGAGKGHGHKSGQRLESVCTFLLDLNFNRSWKKTLGKNTTYILIIIKYFPFKGLFSSHILRTLPIIKKILVNIYKWYKI